MILPQYNRAPHEKSLRNPIATVIIRVMKSDDALFYSEIPELELIGRGKVRDIYSVDEQHLLIVTSDRLSAYDVVLPDPIPGKGKVLTQISLHWFDMMQDLVANQLTELRAGDVLTDASLATQLDERALVVKRLKPLPIEAVVRGYLIGSGWRDYLETGQTSGNRPAGRHATGRAPAAYDVHACQQSSGRRS